MSTYHSEQVKFFARTTGKLLSMQCQAINPLHVENWDELLQQHPDATFFHSQCWARVLCETYNYIPKYFTGFDDKQLCFLLPIMEIRSVLTGRRGVSLPFSDYCNPVVSSGALNIQQILTDLIKFGAKSGWKFMEVRGGDGVVQGPSYCSFRKHSLELSQDLDQTFANFSASTKRNIKKSSRDGVVAEAHNTPEAITDFYRLNCLTRRKHGLPPQPFVFFENIYKYILSENKGMVFLAKHKEQTIAGRLYLHSGQNVIDKYAASDNAYQKLKPNNLIIWEAIKWYASRNYKTLCFGRTSPENTGLIQFKDGFGTDQKSIPYYRYDFRKNEYVVKCSKSSGLHNTLFRKSPLFLSKLTGEVLYRHVG